MSLVPFIHAVCAYINEEGPGLLPFSPGPPPRVSWNFYRDAVNSRAAIQVDVPEAPYEDTNTTDDGAKHTCFGLSRTAPSTYYASLAEHQLTADWDFQDLTTELHRWVQAENLGASVQAAMGSVFAAKWLSIVAIVGIRPFSQTHGKRNSRGWNRLFARWF